MKKKAQFMCSVQFHPVGDTVKAKVDAVPPVGSQERAAEETALLGLLCNLYSLTAALGVVALLNNEGTPCNTMSRVLNRPK